MGGIQPRDHRIAASVLHVLILISDLNIHSFAKGSGESLETDRSATPELVAGLGNFELPEEPPKDGPGEGGRPHHLRPDQEHAAKLSTATYGMNLAASLEISLNRTTPDLRHEECKHWNYPENLPKVSVVIAFHNEGFSTLMRTVHSVLNRSPPQFLEEVILVDDFNQKEVMIDSIKSHIKQLGGKVRLIQNKEREGLMNTRSRGAREARGEIVVFLDAHCEVLKNWLPPLITPIFNNRTTMTVPLIDIIDHDTFEIVSVYPDHMHYRGIFEWGLEYKENILPAREVIRRKHHTEPYKSPTHAGGLLAINREYFLELGTYDPGLLVWGGENFELSFKIWQCGGSLLWVPCSRVGHVYKAYPSYSFGSLADKRRGNLIIGNYKRVVETWMDEKYKEYFYRREPRANYIDMGDISDQLKLKEKLQCKNFQWFLDEVAFDVLIWSPEVPPNKEVGFLMNVAEKSCIARHGKDVPGALTTSICTDGNSIVRLNVRGQLGIADHCISYSDNEVKLDRCTMGTVDGPWHFNETTRTMYHEDEDKCMAVDQDKPSQLSLVACDPLDHHQQWSFLDISSYTFA